MLRIKILLLFFLVLLVSCDDASSNGSFVNENGGTEVLCISENEGMIIRPADSDRDHICKNGSWNVVDSTRHCEDCKDEATSISSSSTLNNNVILSASDESSSSILNSSSSSVQPTESSDNKVIDSSSSTETAEESSSSEKIEVSSSSEEIAMFLCDDEVTYVLDLANCETESSSSEENEESSSSEATTQSSSGNVEESSSSEESEESSSSEESEDSSSSMEQSSSSEVKIAEVKPNNYYRTNCPEGLTCEYVNTEFLNQTLLDNNNYGEILDERDGQVYKTTVIGEQIWLAQNLNYDSLNFSRCYGAVEENCNKYGRLYPIDVAKKVCPSDWRLPQKDDVQTLLGYIKERYPNDSTAHHVKSMIGYLGLRDGESTTCIAGVDENCSSMNGMDTYGLSLAAGGVGHLEVTDDIGIGKTPSFWTSSTGKDFGNMLNLPVIYEITYALDYSGKPVGPQGWLYRTIGSRYYTYVRCIKD